MAVGELVISIFQDEIMMELFTKKNKKRTLIGKHFEKYSVSLSDFNKIDAMDIEKFVQEFLKGTTIKRGQVHIVFYGNENEEPFTEIEVDTTNKKEIKQLLPLEIEGLGEMYNGLTYKYIVLGSKVKIYFAKRNIIDNLMHMNIGKDWEIVGILPSTLAYQGLVPGDGLLVDVGKDNYTIYGFRGGYVKSREEFSIYTDFSIDRPVNPTVNELFETIQQDLTEYVHSYNFNEGTEIDMVYMNFLGNIDSTFTSKEVENILFESPRDLREWLDVNEDKEEYRSNKYVKENCNNFNYSAGTLGYFYVGKDLYNYNFSPERLSLTCKNLLVTALSFSLLLSATLPTFGVLTAERVDTAKADVQSFEQSIQGYNDVIEGLSNQIKEKDSTIDDYNSYVSSLGRLTDTNRNFISGVLHYLPENTPASIIVKEIKLDKDDKTLKIKGVSNNYKDIGSLAMELEEFGTVKIPKIENNNLVNEQGYPFSLELTSR